jgi:hypothetical protein
MHHCLQRLRTRLTGTEPALTRRSNVNRADTELFQSNILMTGTSVRMLAGRSTVPPEIKTSIIANPEVVNKVIDGLIKVLASFFCLLILNPLMNSGFGSK